MTRPLRRLFFALSLLLCAVSTAAAQVGSTAQMTGTVRDESGGVLPGADVMATQTETGFKRSAVTDVSGSYTLSNLPIGPYKLEVSLSGFRSYAQTGIVLQVNANPVVNVTLPLGDLTETVSVEAATPLVETRSPSIGTVIDNERIEELPLNGRNPTELIQLAGAAVGQGGSSSRSMQGSNGGQAIAVAGGQGFGVAYLLDGAMHNNPYDNLNLPLPFPDALQEFRVETSSTTANNGMHSGASVNVATKSGTNLLHGDLFAFNRDHRFNATDFFARTNPATGKRQDDGLTRNQFGGTLGGPIVEDRLFFFAGYQGTRTRQSPADLFSFVPTAQMLAGDFSTFASAQCNTTGAVTLRAPFVNNQINPALFSPAALNLVKHLPTTTDPCGRATYTRPSKTDEGQYIAKIDYQRTSNDTLFGRYMRTSQLTPPPLGLSPDNILVSTIGGRDNVAHSLTLGDTRVISNTTVNAIRVAWNKTDIHRTHVPFGFSAPALGVKAYSYLDDYALISVTNGFTIGGGTESEATFVTPAWQVGDDLTMVRGTHQFGFGGSLAFWKSLSQANVRSPGMYTFNGSITGLGLADFLTGKLNGFIESAPNTLDMQQRYVGLYAQDTWKLSHKATLNYGVRWEPFIAQQIRNGAIYNFNLDRFLNNVHTTVFKNAPAGFLYPGDSEFPNDKAGMNNKWGQFSPRVGFAWDPSGDGRMSIRGGYSLAYDFVDGQFHLNTSVAPPWGSDIRLTNPPGGFDDPFTGSGVTNPFPITFDANAPFPLNGAYIAIDPDIAQPRQQSWNVTWQRQFGNNTAVSASYLGSHSDRLWNVVSLNEGQFLGTGPCTLRVPVTASTPTGLQTFPNCSTPASVDARRKLRLQNFEQGQYLGAVDLHTALGRQNYNGLLLAVQRRAANGVTVNANYTLSKCMGHPTQGGGTPNINSGYVNPNDIDYDYGACASDRRHIFNLTLGAQSPEFKNKTARLVASDWRVSAIYRLTAGAPLTVTVNTDPAATGIGSQRANVVVDDPYGDRSLNNYLNPAAFAQPAPGTYGNQERGWFTGPGYRNVDLALVRAFRFATTHRIEARVESFNLFNWTRWSDPQTSLNSSQFGKITSATGDPRVMQFALKYSF